MRNVRALTGEALFYELETPLQCLDVGRDAIENWKVIGDLWRIVRYFRYMPIGRVCSRGSLLMSYIRNFFSRSRSRLDGCWLFFSRNRRQVHDRFLNRF